MSRVTASGHTVSAVTLPFTYQVASVGRTRDGDTYEWTVRIAHDLLRETVARMYGYDTPETSRGKCGACGLYTSAGEKQRATMALALAREFITGPGDLWCRVDPDDPEDSFGRELVQVWHEIGDVATSLGQVLVDAHLATVWPIRWHHVYDPFRNLPLLALSGAGG